METRASGCRLCEALQNRDRSQRPCDSLLFETEYFVLLPALGPLLIGHALITSKSHWTSLASMPSEALHDYDKLVRTLAALPPVSADVLEAEHGSTSDCTAGACVAHTHVNIIPGAGRHIDLFSNHLPVLAEFPELPSIQGIDEPYILLRGNLAKTLLYRAESAASQAIRRSLCNRLGVTEWDWRVNARAELITQSIAFWKEALPSA